MVLREADAQWSRNREEHPAASSKKAPRRHQEMEDERGPCEERTTRGEGKRQPLPPPSPPPPLRPGGTGGRFTCVGTRDDERKGSTKKDDKDDRKKDQHDEKSKKKDDKDDRKWDDKKEKNKKKDNKKKDDGKKVEDDRKKDKAKKEVNVPQAAKTVKKALATPPVKKGGSLGQDIAAIVQRNKKDLVQMQEEKKVKENQLSHIDAQVQMLGDEVMERQTKIKALQLSRIECLTAIEESADAIKKKQNELLESSSLHAKYEKENRGASASPSSSGSSSYYTEEEAEEEAEEGYVKKK